MTFEELSNADRIFITLAYRNKSLTKSEVQAQLSDKFDVSTRTIRRWANKLDLNTLYKTNPNKILIYDIETSRAVFTGWWSGQQFVSGNQIIKEPKIISIAWNWLGEDEIHELHWDMKTHCDKAMVEEFLKVYNSADMIVGQNNDRFDNRWINARAYKHNLYVDVFVKSFDIQKEHKRLMRLPSYSMKFIGKFKGYTEKLNHEGIIMWDMIERGTPAEQREYMDKMLEYGRGDIITTKEMYLGIIKYAKIPVHFGVLNGKDKYSCPLCGGDLLTHVKTMTTTAGTKQHVMMCENDQHVFKISDTLFLKNNVNN